MLDEPVLHLHQPHAVNLDAPAGALEAHERPDVGRRDVKRLRDLRTVDEELLRHVRPVGEGLEQLSIRLQDCRPAVERPEDRAHERALFRMSVREAVRTPGLPVLLLAEKERHDVVVCHRILQGCADAALRDRGRTPQGG